MIAKKMLPSGATRYEVVVDGPRDGATGQRKQLRRRFTTKKEAVTWEAQAKVQVDAGTFVGRERVTVDVYLDEWLGGLNKVKESTSANYTDALKPVRRIAGATALQALSKADVQLVVAGMLNGSLRVRGRKGTPLSALTVRSTLIILGMALDAAVAEGRLTRNVAALVERPAGGSPRRKIWTAKDVEGFQEAASKDRLAGVWALTLCGLRRGEVLGLSWADLDLTDPDSGLVHVHQSRILVQGASVQQDSTKTKAGVRTVPLLPEHVAALKTTSAQLAEERLAAGPAWADSGLVAVDAVGRPVAPRWYSDRFQALSRQAGVPVVRLHDARHAYGSHLLDQGIPVAIVSILMGHSSPAVTTAIYTHAVKSDTADDRVRAAMRGAGYGGRAAVGL